MFCIIPSLRYIFALYLIHNEMKTYSNQPDRTVAALIHVSTFTKYFIPLGNFIIPLILWTAKKEDSFVDDHGRRALNFQISIFLYFVFLVGIGISGVVFLGLEMSSWNQFNNFHPFVDVQNITQALPVILYVGFIGLLLLALFILDIVAVITATIKASEGAIYKYPLSINFIRPTSVGTNQSKNEQFNNTQNEKL